MYDRLSRGWSRHDALTRPVRVSLYAKKAHAHGISPETVRRRIKDLGWSIEDALTRQLWVGVKRKCDLSMTQRARAAGFKPQTIHRRMQREGLTLDAALKIPLRKTGEILARARAAGLHPSTIYKRCTRYGLTFEQAIAVPRRCESCGGTSKLVADHNHKTGKFRGWLCEPCNWGLGHFKDDPIRLRKAIQYISHAQKTGKCDFEQVNCT